MNEPIYVLVTCAKNEAEFIGRTVASVASQTLLPAKWVIVDDGSSDRTPDLIEEHRRTLPFMEVLRLPPKSGRDFSSKIKAFKEGERLLKGIPYDFIGNLDADVEFEPDYYRSVITEFTRDCRLGIASGAVLEWLNGRMVAVKTKPTNAPGAIHLFRRECYEEIGGFRELNHGGYDSLAEYMARMKGWRTATLSWIKVLHLKPRNSAFGDPLERMKRSGRRDYYLGYGMVVELLKCGSRLGDKPFLAGSLMHLLGYSLPWILRRQREVPGEVARYINREQWSRLNLFKREKKGGGRRVKARGPSPFKEIGS